ncbi:MAG TPA: DUF4340 domain-containing protein [Burkholderiaceae bacterium]|nr:DUF4340 domain-containing protein [Burkholderiaceae bacterium]
MTMMTKTHRRLGILLAAQVLLAALLGWWQWREPASAAGQPLLAFDKSAVDKLVIEGPDKSRVELLRKASTDGKSATWQVAQAGDFAADASQVDQLVGRLHGVAAGAPVATSAEAAERFRVADAAFERRITVESGGKPLATLLLGSSQGARQTYARKAGASEVHAIDLAAHEVPAKADDWLDKAALRTPLSEIVGIAVDGFELTRAARPDVATSSASAAASAVPGAAAPSWQAQGLKPHERVDSAAADRLAQALADVRFNGLRGRDEQARKDLGPVELLVAVRRRDGQRVDYTLRRLPAGDERALLVSNRPETFTLTQAQAKALSDAAARKALVSAPSAAK